MKTKYDKIGINYNLTRRADKYISDRLFYHLDPDWEKQYLDLGCGTGNYTIELFNKGIQNIIGIDPSKKMILDAKSRNNQIKWTIGTAERTNLNNESVDGIICCLTIHHWPDLSKAFIESNRVLKKNGKYIFFTSTPEQIEGYWLNHYFPKMLSDSIQQMPSLEIVKKKLEASGFDNIKTEKYFVSDSLQDCFLYCGKQRPELYLEPEIRNGISSFADLAIRDEINNGIAKLKKDIDSGNIKSIIDQYDNKKGDYLFIICNKA